MSTDFRGLRLASNDPTTQIIVELQKKLAKFLTTQQVDLIDSENEDIYANGQDVDSIIKYHTFQSQKKFTTGVQYFPTFEPDNQFFVLDLSGRSLGNELPDKSGFANDAFIYGDPTLVESTFDPGIVTQGTKSIALRMNRPTSPYQNQEYLRIPDAANLRINGMTTGFSMFFRVQVNSLADQNGYSMTLFQKIDDATPTNAAMLQISATGKLIFIVKRSGTTTANETATGTITAGAVYDIFVTFTITGPVMHIYVNGVDKSLTTFAGAVNWQSSTTDFDMYCFQRGPTLNGGFVYVDMFKIRRYQGMVVSSTQVSNMNTNKLTISPTAFGHVMITDYWAAY